MRPAGYGPVFINIGDYCGLFTYNRGLLLVDPCMPASYVSSNRDEWRTACANWHNCLGHLASVRNSLNRPHNPRPLPAEPCIRSSGATDSPKALHILDANCRIGYHIELAARRFEIREWALRFPWATRRFWARQL